MERHETPLDVARILAKWAPRKLTSLLEPAVGKGALLRPFIPLVHNKECRVVCVDIDTDVIAQFEAGVGRELAGQVVLIDGDFLTIDRGEMIPEGSGGFDCIIMNPPFAARVKREVEDQILRAVRKVPIEIAFVARAVELLRDGGVILAVVPPSVVSSLQGRWIREYLLSKGCIRCVHELPKNTFSSVEAKVYLMVFEKGGRAQSVTLCNHSLEDPEKLFVRKNMLGDEKRLDFSYHNANNKAREIRMFSGDARWTRMADLAEITRGTAGSPRGVERAIHTTDFRQGFWCTERLQNNRLPGEVGRGTIASQDMLIMRVGRNCYRSVGCIAGEGAYEITDCVVRIRPRRGVDLVQLLFALRCALSWDVGRDLVQRGSGASYILPEDLNRLYVPYGLAVLYPRIFALYGRACQGGRSGVMELLEACVRSRLVRRVKREILSQLSPARADALNNAERIEPWPAT